MICESEATKTAYELFLKEKPEWNPDNLNSLVNNKLVSSDYLIDDKPEKNADKSLCSVSWYAANAYCEWLTGRLPASMSDYEVRLPYEAELELAYRANSFTAGLWEWCADPYAPLNFIKADFSAIKTLGSQEYLLRKGNDRGSLPPDFCSSYVSLRPVIALKTR